jgi:tRNA threonylcarbamoyladenosine biosynthesis protein TsaE
MTHVTIVASPASGACASPARDFIWKDEGACAALAACLADHLGEALRADSAPNSSFYIELHGTLGAGKTTFTRHLLRALGVDGRIKSPSYAVVEPHELPGLNIQHFDFYRFNDPQEWEDAGFRDLFAAPGLKLAEWPDKAEGLLPTADLRIDIATSSTDAGRQQRDVRVQALTRAGQEALHALGDLPGSAEAAPSVTAGVPAHG